MSSVYEQAFKKIKEILSRNKDRLDNLESKVALLEARLSELESTDNPWKMPFDV